MKIVVSIFFLFLFTSLFSQDTTTRYGRDTLISFFGTKPLRLHDYDNRVVPYGDPLPLYVCINYSGGKRKNIEYFRQDSTSYLVYEYYSNGQDKGRGRKVIRDSIVGISRTLGRNDVYSTLIIHNYKELSREGKWEEYDDSIENYKTYWTGEYLNNKRVGLWQHLVGSGSEEDFVSEEINYDVDSVSSKPKKNLALSSPLEDLSKIVEGYWNLRDCDNEKQPRMIYAKSDSYGESDGDSKQHSYETNHYEFKKDGLFERSRGDGCFKFRENSLRGKWKITENMNLRVVQITFTNGQIWNLKIIYLDEEGNLVTERLGKNYR
jgi:hypothetical protein